MSDLVHKAAQNFREWREHPSKFVRDVFKAVPDPWQDEVLESSVRDPQQAMLACKGPGKSATLAWLGWNWLSCRPDCKGVAISITEDNLRDGLWTEMAKWQMKSPMLRDQFVWTASRIFYRHKPEVWWLSARSWPRSGNNQQQADSLAGLHADTIFILMDEAGGIPRSLLATAQAIGSSAKEWLIAIAGNPTNQDSALGEAAIQQRHRWKVTEITSDPDDPMRTTRVPKQWAQDQIEMWGRDNPWVLVNVFGRFPPTALNTLLSPDDVRESFRRWTGASKVEGVYKDFPLIFGVDVARFGDDESVVFPRRGKIAYLPYRMRNLDTLQGASHVSRLVQERGASSIQIDITGGFGAGWYDALKVLGHQEVIGVGFGSKARQQSRFFNKRAEIFWELAEWIKDGGMLPKVDEMVHGLSTMQYTYSRDGRIQLEEKEQIKARIGRSPDLEDALACTFGYPVSIPRKNVLGGPEELSTLLAQRAHRGDYDPWDRYQREKERDHG